MRVMFDPIIPVPLLVIVAATVIALAIIEDRTWRTRKAIGGALNIGASILVALSLLAMGTRPYIEGEREAVDADVKEMDIVLVVDSTLSMWVKDEDGKARIDKAREDADAIMEAAPGCSVAVVSFANDARQLTPFTTDRESIDDALAMLRPPESYNAEGTDISKPVELVATILTDRYNLHPERPKVLFFMSDGEQTVGNYSGQANRSQKYLDSGLVLGYGNPSGSPVTDANGAPVLDYSTFEQGVSALDAKALSSIASGFGVGYSASSDDGAAKAASEARRSWEVAPSTDGQVNIRSRSEGYHIVAVPLAAGLALWVLAAARERGIAAQEEARSGAYRNRKPESKVNGGDHGSWK